MNKKYLSMLLVLLSAILLSGHAVAQEKKRLIIDTDAWAEIDDQYAITYALFSGNHFEVEGITVNRGSDGPHRTDLSGWRSTIQAIDNHYNEAVTVARLCASSHVPIRKGPAGNYRSVRNHVNNATFDGSAAVNFIIERAHAPSSRLLHIYACGNLTNVALALLKDPTIAPKIVIWWLGTEHPNNYACNNHAGDLDAASAILANPQNVPFNIIPWPVLKGLTWDEIQQKMPGKGPQINPALSTRLGTYSRVGDYLTRLFDLGVGSRQKTNGRRLLDLVGFTAVKNNVGRYTSSQTGAPSFNYQSATGSERHMHPGTWVANNNNPRKVTWWRSQDRDAVYNDFFNTVNN